MIPGHKRLRCEAFGRAQQSFGQTTCHRTIPGELHRSQQHTPALSQSFDSKRSCHVPSIFGILLPRTEHGCRDSHLPAVPHTEDAEEKGRQTRGFGGCQHNPTCTAPTTTTPPVPQNLKTLLLKQHTQAVNDRIPAKGCRHLLVKLWASGTGKGNTCQLCGAIINDKGAISGTSKPIQRKLVIDEGKRHSSRTVEGRTELDLVQDEVDEAKRSLEEAHVEVQAAQNKVTEAAFRLRQAMADQETVGGGTRNQPINEDRPDEAFAGRHQKDKSHMG